MRGRPRGEGASGGSKGKRGTSGAAAWGLGLAAWVLGVLLLLVPPVWSQPGEVAPPPRPLYEYRQQHDPYGIGKFYMGREIARVMSYRGAGWLERPERVREEEPEKLLAALELKDGLVVADVGAGSGYHSVRIAPRVAPRGKVLACDIQPEMLDLIAAKARRLKLTNIETIRGTPQDPRLPAEAVDLILMVDVYHEFEYPYEMMEKLVAALKAGGRIVFVEFRLEDDRVPILTVHKMSERQVLREMSLFPQLQHERTIGTLPWQHIIIFRKREVSR
ncbi:class I SAM-dependent methyltransferase [Thermogemmata fonticola]|uniref:Class I SAM-dependent methyltransferase n=1 Tax=Thermogemmata fonticola TaxID=2755323 RepID=A0A7V8VGP1_9BACT|nr:class I SAM-dependent methyltransferase [Thermogemmata fonticola]MBA2227560.1 class I SAM-dependent methyltransferase [Thermogemmata fonticola]